MEDPIKLKKILTQLNKGLLTPDWEGVEGFNTMLEVVPDGYGGQNVNSNRGITVKAFINKRTKEIKVYYFEAVKKDG